MNLIYVWNEDYLNKEKYRQTGFCLSTKFDVKYDIENNEVTVIQNPNYISKFWGENIFDVMAIVGDNGAGKTMLLNYLMEVLRCMGTGSVFNMEFFVIFEDEDSNRLKVFSTPKYLDIEVCSDIISEKEQVGENPNYILSVYKFGYFTNILSLNDYQSARSGYIYDASIGGLIRNIAREDREMYYKKADEDDITNYFTNQFRRVIEFLYKSNLNDVEIGFNKPKRLDIYINQSSASEEHIIDALEKMRANNAEIDEILKKRNFRIAFYLQPIIKKYSRTWTSNLVISLITNLFRELCVSQFASEQRDKEAVTFINLLKDFKNKKSREETIYKETVGLINSISEKIDRSYQCENYRNFILWLEKNENYILEGRKNNPHYCSIPLDDEHEKFIMELLVHYKNTNFEFPYFIFRLGLSTGELNFLNLYANMYNMLSRNKNGEIVVTNPVFSDTIDCTNILLAFDEADLSLHPKWQQKYLYWLLEFIKSVFPMCQVHVIIATHSPIMLSDFPNENILYLDDKCADTKRNVKTFGSNIHDLFLDSFFLSSTGTIGEFAEQKIKEIVNQLNNEELSDAEKENILKIIHSVGDDVVRNKLLQLYSQKANKYVSQEKKVEDSDTIDMTINLLKMQKEQIDRMIIELEQKKK